MSLLLVVLFFAAVAMAAEAPLASTITVAPNRSFCMFEDKKRDDGSQYGARYQVKEGTIAVELSSPNSVLYKAAADTANTIAFKAHEDGRYKLCFNNPSASPVAVTFTLIDDTINAPGANQKEPTQAELFNLVEGLKRIHSEQQFMMQRELEHKEVSGRTNSRILWGIMFNVCLVAGTTYWLMQSLKGLFDTRRVV